MKKVLTLSVDATDGTPADTKLKVNIIFYVILNLLFAIIKIRQYVHSKCIRSLNSELIFYDTQY